MGHTTFIVGSLLIALVSLSFQNTNNEEVLLTTCNLSNPIEIVEC